MNDYIFLIKGNNHCLASATKLCSIKELLGGIF